MTASGAGSVGLIFGLFGVLFIIWLLFIAAAIFAFVFWVIMIVDVSKRNFKKPDDKTMWVLVVVLAGIIGAIVYYFVIKKPNKK